ncbi:hypothetical protein Pmar_PMAR006425 [Perkinsus marinus ATCC 50983]|uniref:Uncharacterized protein n=1 Tax=Perkinsus marinus (strain ATCC 50983 / TXsc) TaxID=423536 RepID=C5K9N3_PERM5|nr:hypothetical protein Pmar_PMAR006425 [Perkinsus marinus ATCC 50983]EER18805.1 hypothetical protein Pmar_PMAR006425 [Perkinsus marinus ATCC 50983]|eukprot:XP_002787009.1 hypothetical protein Pmar_PMAR006425 [Perkinsus marinus ATCC 50983]
MTEFNPMWTSYPSRNTADEMRGYAFLPGDILVVVVVEVVVVVGVVVVFRVSESGTTV